MITVDIDALASAIVAKLPTPEPIDAPLLVDGNRLAELLSISRPTVDRLVRDDRVPSIMIGTRRLYRPDDVIKALEANQ